MKPPIMNIADVELRESPVPLPSGLESKFGGAKLGTIGGAIGAKKLGYNLTVVPPGRRAFPFHSHRVNEEMFVVFEGTGEVRIGSERFPIRKGDVIACPPDRDAAANQASLYAHIPRIGGVTCLFEVASVPGGDGCSSCPGDTGDQHIADLYGST